MVDLSSSADACPSQRPSHRPSQRKIVRPGEDRPERAPVERIGSTWHIRSHDVGRELLRVSDGFTQSGFNADFLGGAMTRMRLPILYADGGLHRAQRTAVARYFTPKVVDTRYSATMHAAADRLIAHALTETDSDFSELAFHYSVEVAAEVIGLGTDDIVGLSTRLEKLIDMPSLDPSQDMPRARVARLALAGQAAVAAFWWHDVRPAIAEHRRRPRQDVISHLLDSGYNQFEIVTECVTYGAAGMVTTREYLQAALWHLLTDPDLRAEYTAADRAGRAALLVEILRLEPVVGHLYRRATQDHLITVDGRDYDIRRGERLDIYVRATNVDPAAVHPEPERLCANRPKRPAVRAEALSFGDGAHRCPGNSLAIEESAVLLDKLLAHDLTLVSEPTVGWEDIVAGYQLHGLRIRVRPPR